MLFYIIKKDIKFDISVKLKAILFMQLHNLKLMITSVKHRIFYYCPVCWNVWLRR